MATLYTQTKPSTFDVVKTRGKVVTVNSQSIRVLERDSNGYISKCSGTVTITDGGAGYAVGCIYTKTDGAAGGIFFINEGSTSSADFNAFETSGSAGTFTDLTATGNTTLGNAVTDTLAITGATTLTTTSANGLVVGANGATNPVLKVACSTASVATGVSITGAAAAGGVAIAAISSGANENITLDALGTGTITLGGTSTGNIVLGRATGVTGALTVTSAGASALAVGLNGSTNPALTVDASTASSATGLRIKSAAAAAGVAVDVTSSGANENLTINALGSGTITFGNTSTGQITFQRATTVNSSFICNGAAGVAKGEALPAGGNSNASITATTTANFGFYFGSGAPSVNAAKGSMYLRSDGSGVGDRAYINTDGAGTWTAITTVA